MTALTMKGNKPFPKYNTVLLTKFECLNITALFKQQLDNIFEGVTDNCRKRAISSFLDIFLVCSVSFYIR